MNKFVAAAVMMILPVSCFACGAGKIIFEDKFQAAGQGWGVNNWGKNVSFSKDGMLVTLDPGTRFVITNQSNAYVDYEVCLTVQIKPAPGDDVSSNFETIFWKQDINNLFYSEISASGAFSVQHLVGGRQLIPIPWTKNAALKTDGSFNEMSIKVIGKHAVLFGNGQQLAEFDGAYTNGPTIVGLCLQSMNTAIAPASFLVKDFQIRETSE